MHPITAITTPLMHSSLFLLALSTLCLLQLSLTLPVKTDVIGGGKGVKSITATKYHYFTYKERVYKIHDDMMPSRPTESIAIMSSTRTVASTPTRHSPSINSHRRDGRRDSMMIPSKEEFIKAFISNRYKAPTDEQYDAFVKGIDASTFSSKREVAMFLAQIMHESGGLRVKAEERCVESGCPGEYETWEDVSGRRYYGRGYIQLTWSYNYKSASEALFGDPHKLLKHPELVSTDEDIAWWTSFWFWRRKVHPVDEVQEGQFGYSTLKINGGQECGENAGWLAKRRFRLYVKTLLAFNLDEEADPKGCY